MSTAADPLSAKEPDRPETIDETAELIVDAAGVLLAFALVGERLDAVQLVGGAVILVGALVLYAR